MCKQALREHPAGLGPQKRRVTIPFAWPKQLRGSQPPEAKGVMGPIHPLPHSDEANQCQHFLGTHMAVGAQR